MFTIRLAGCTIVTSP